jgi:spermidine synthase
MASIVKPRGARRGAAGRRRRRRRRAARTSARSLLLFAFASGFLVFAAEVVETHLLTLLIGNSAYAFGLMLAVFLVCLALGAARASPPSRRGTAKAALGRGLALAALALAAHAVPLWDQLPRFFAAGQAGRRRGPAASCAARSPPSRILAHPHGVHGHDVPALLLARIARRASDVAAQRRPTLTAANTAGTIVGSITDGLLRPAPARLAARRSARSPAAFAVLAASPRSSPARRAEEGSRDECPRSPERPAVVALLHRRAGTSRA